MIRCLFAVAVASLVVVGSGPAGRAQSSPPKPPSPPQMPRAGTGVPAMERLGPSLYRIGRMQVDTAKREVTIPGRLNDVTTLEFVACTRGGAKAYESAITLETDAIAFNAAMLLIGLDKSRGRAPAHHFDPKAPEGDPVEMFVEWTMKSGPPGGRAPIEELLFNERTKQTVPPGTWVYTGSTLQKDGSFLAELDGVLVGFVHSPAPVIEHVGGLGVNDYGNIVLNPKFRKPPIMPVTLVIRALGRTAGKH